jgi:hypothetical protein
MNGFSAITTRLISRDHVLPVGVQKILPVRTPCVSVITVRHPLISIFDKLGVATRQKLLIRTHQYSLVEFSVPA